MLKQLVEQRVSEILSEAPAHQETIDYHDEMASEHNREWQKAQSRLERGGPRLSDKDAAYLARKRDAHMEGYMNHIDARNAHKKGSDKKDTLTAKAAKFDEDMIGKGHI